MELYFVRVLTLFTISSIPLITAFIPNWWIRLGSFSFSRTHENIIEDAVRRVALEYMNDHLDYYPAADQKKFLDSHSFSEAIEDFQKFVAKPDLDENMKHNPVNHFDAEKILESNELLKNNRSQIRESIIIKKDFTNARRIAGVALHALQDFYSHSNWVETVGPASFEPFEELGNNKLSGLSWTVAVGDTCGNCWNSNSMPCYAYLCEKFKNQKVFTSPAFARCLETDGLNSCIDNNFNTSVSSSAAFCPDPGFTDKVTYYASKIFFPDECQNNILTSLDSHVLTTGYFSEQIGYSSKKSGKCSHGGLFDCTRFDNATGGINKDSSAKFVSPHYQLHPQAAKIAVNATVLYLNWIKDDLAHFPGSFPKFIGLSTGSTLCFVIDTTGSMSEEIAAVRAQTIKITQDRSSGEDKPSDYLLVPFNDPGWGPVTFTENASQMIEELSKLKAYGGGDEPELGYNGILRALEIVRPGSTCHLFTDASAKDTDLFPTALVSKLRKKTNFISWLTPYTGFTKRRRRSLRRSKRQGPRTAITDYGDFTTTGRGSLYVLRKSDILQAVGAISVSILQVKVFTGDNRQLGFPFFVDTLLSDVILTVSDKHGSILSINVTSMTNDTKYTDFNTPVNLPSLKVYNFSTIVPGWWYVNVSTNRATNIYGLFSASVQANSFIGLRHNFALFSSGPHPGYDRIDDKPLAGTSYFILITITGSTDPITNQNRFIRNITSLLFLTTTGDVLQNLTLYEVTPLKEYGAESVLPNQAFRIAVEGVDEDGFTFRRMDDATIQTAVVQLSLTLSDNTTLSVLPGNTVNVSLLITSAGSSATWSIKVSDTASFYTGLLTVSVNLNTNESIIFNMSFTVNATTIPGTESTVTVTAGTSSDTSVENYIQFPVTVTSPYYTIDTIPPVCAIVASNSSSCNATSDCSTDATWYIEFNVQDKESGLFQVMPNTSYSINTFYVDPFTVGTVAVVKGTYKASCCSPNVTIAVFDRYGNRGECNAVVKTYANDPSTSDVNNAVLILALSIGGAVAIVVVILVVTGLCISKMNMED